MMRTRRSLRTAGLGAALLLAGCASEEASGERTGDRSLDAADFDIDPRTEPVYTIGALDGEPWETFGQVTTVAFDEAGNLFILDRSAAHVVMIDPAGDHVRTISNKGDGPGELANPFGMVVLSGGRVAVFDFSKLGFQVFGSDGVFIESVAFDPQTGVPGGLMVATPDDRVVSAGGVRFSMGGELPDEPEGRPIDRFDLDGSRDVVYTAWSPPAAEEGDHTELSSGGNRMALQMQRMRAFEPPLHIGVLSDGRVVVSDSVGYRIKLVGSDGSVSRTLERPIEPTPVTDEIEALERERQLDAIQGRSGGGVMITVTGNVSRGGGGGIDQDAIRRMMEDRVDDMLFFPEIPVVARLGVDWSDRVWVQRAGELPGEPGPTDILSADGQYLGTIAPDGLRIPAAFGPAGLLAYIETDELDVQRVRVARLSDDEALETGR